jgi:hypothetical protein
MELDALGWNVLAAAVAVAALHTVLGPDHYLPFVMLARARRWSRRRTLGVTAACGAGHVLSSLALGLGGAALGAGLGVIDEVEAWRGPIAAWALCGFGSAYALWGVRRALRRTAGLALHRHGGELHLHAHGGERHAHFEALAPAERGLAFASARPGAHVRGPALPRPQPSHDRALPRSPTFWALFVVFVLGPCEPLIPLFFLPASRGRWGLALATAAVFGVVTLAAMLALVALAQAGFEKLAIHRLERWSHALAGGVIALSGFAVLAFGL